MSGRGQPHRLDTSTNPLSQNLALNMPWVPKTTTWCKQCPAARWHSFPVDITLPSEFRRSVCLPVPLSPCLSSDIGLQRTGDERACIFSDPPEDTRLQ